MLKITAIELENFQSIGEKTLIPIRQLTMLFGPNGAGKSAVFDALELLELICSNDWGVSNRKLTDYLDRWSRNNSLNESTNQLGIGIYLKFPDNWELGDESIWERHLEAFSTIYHRDFCSFVQMGTDEEDFERGLHLHIKFERFGEIQATEEGLHNIDDWFLQSLTLDFRSCKILEMSSHDENHSLIRIYKNEFNLFSNIERAFWEDNPASVNIQTNLAVSGGSSSEGCVGIDKGSIYAVVDKYPIGQVVVGGTGKVFRTMFEHSPENSMQVKEVTASFQEVFEQTLGFFFAIIHPQLCNNSSLPLVKASRSIPSRDEIISIVGKGPHDYPYDYPWWVSVLRDEDLQETPLLKRLANELNRQEDHWIYLCSIVAEDSALKSVTQEGTWSNLSALAKLNSLFSDELFLENGYRLVGDVSCLVDINDFQGDEIRASTSYARLVRLYLKDACQRALEIEDVGSGIGYVLPVLAALVSDGPALIQQPELHLHPAMQSALGEAIVKAVENKKLNAKKLDELDFSSYTILETHSEHLLLRVMRLLKTSKDRGASQEALCPLTYENVSILYFDPKPDGSTQVKRLRLAPDGSFVDRWPRGFFTERYNDLFYE